MNTAPQYTGEDALQGHLPPDAALSLRRALGELPPSSQRWLNYPPPGAGPDPDNARLPAALAETRLRAREFARQHMAPLALTIDATPHWPVGEPPQALLDLLVTAGRHGWMSDMLPRPFGSLSWREARHPLVLRSCLKVEEFSRVCGGQMLLLCAHMLGQMPLLLSGQLSVLRRMLWPAYREIHRGTPHLFAFAITEPNAGSDAEDGHGASHNRPALVARQVAGGWKLRGRKVFISGGDLARSFTVFAALEGEGYESWTCFLVSADTPGFRPARTELKMGMRASGAAELEFDDAFVPDKHIIGGLRGGWSLNRATLNLSRIPVAAMAVGFAQAATDIATDFACRVKAGNRALVHYQDVQLSLAQMMAETSAIRALVWHSARTWTPQQASASIAKFHCSDVAMRVIESAMDLLGNHTLLHSQRLEKLYRDARLTQIFEGTNQINRLAVIEDHQEQLLDRISRYQTAGIHPGEFMP